MASGDTAGSSRPTRVARGIAIERLFANNKRYGKNDVINHIDPNNSDHEVSSEEEEEETDVDDNDSDTSDTSEEDEELSQIGSISSGRPNFGRNIEQ